MVGRKQGEVAKEWPILATHDKEMGRSSVLISGGMHRLKSFSNH